MRLYKQGHKRTSKRMYCDGKGWSYNPTTMVTNSNIAYQTVKALQYNFPGLRFGIEENV